MVKGGKNQQWLLGDKAIKEAKAYEYLGTIINHQLNDSEYINDHLDAKAKKFDSYVRFALAKHMAINRIHFGASIG